MSTAIVGEPWPKSGSVNRRHVLSLLVALFTAPAPVPLRANTPTRASSIVVIDGWVLLAADVTEISQHVA